MIAIRIAMYGCILAGMRIFWTRNGTVLLVILPPFSSSAINFTLSSPVQPVSGVRYAVLPAMSIVMCCVSVAEKINMSLSGSLK